ncbi:ureidoglycolate hydrolase [Podospora aff. communis PSN243]|uniref:Ureidoglycolate hydrolase n=1 Tax=Podospora aff. communis PSN243 TaxID=3040156 RepID=A0AAV9GKJ0_9PEZI|nr:ureidoglycolate hydrolase [Podospora aff. communis PSN243]
MAEQLTITLSGRSLIIDAKPLRPSSFSPFGDVVENPQPHLHPSSAATTFAKYQSIPFSPIVANQGTAIKYQHVTLLIDLYAQAPSRRPGIAVTNMFVCASRKPLPSSSSSSSGRTKDKLFPVTVLERHPYTTQTFIPLSGTTSRYLVIVAPTLPPSSKDAHLPVPTAPTTNPHVGNHKLPGRGLPDLKRLKAFVATTDQAVTYAAGTWHAPMAVLGEEGTRMDFVVVQFANGVGVEDCQEVFLEGSSPEEVAKEGTILVRVPRGTDVVRKWAKL